jgi:hypothetical protein
LKNSKVIFVFLLALWPIDNFFGSLEDIVPVKSFGRTLSIGW